LNRVWRVTKRRHASAAYSGEGARLAGGRWNHPGIPVAYASESQALAGLEYLVNSAPTLLPPGLVIVRADIPDDVAIDIFDRSRLPRNWRDYDPSPEELQDIGDAWLLAMNAAVLKVPSAVVPAEHNFLVNPAHPDLKKIRIGSPETFIFDARLLRPGVKDHGGGM